jgi:hypothetical protein
MHVLVCGSREWTDKAAIKRELASLLLAEIGRDGSDAELVLIHGDCRGADRLAAAALWELSQEKVVVERGARITILPFPADWNQHKKAAGPIRNRQMLTEGKPKLALCFHANLASSKGSKDMVNAARAAGVEVLVITC